MKENWNFSINHDANSSEGQGITGDPYEKADLSKEEPGIFKQFMQQIDNRKPPLPESPCDDVSCAEGALVFSRQKRHS